MSKPIVKMENIVKKYGDLAALDHFNLDVYQGEILGLLGPNGSGKTTAINCLLSLLKYDKGSINVFEKPMTPISYDIKQKIGIVPQHVAVFDELTVVENIDYFCGLYVSEKVKRKQLVDESMDFVGLNEFKKFLPKKLSGGLLRRLNIACGISHRPQLLIMDEPTVAVDPQSRNKILEGIVELNQKGTTIIYTSHYMEEVEQISSRIVIMDKGKNLAQGTNEQLKMMIKTGETIEIEVMGLGDEHIEKIKAIKNIFSVKYDNKNLVIQCDKGEHNLVEILDYLKNNDVVFGHVYSRLPTLNDVFLEITGKELRD